MIGIIINILAVITGGIFGTVFSRRISRDFTDKLNGIMGLCSMGMGIFSIVVMENMTAVIISLAAGTALGLLLHLGDKILSAARLLQRPVAKLCPSVEGDEAAQASYMSLLLTAVVLFCASGTGIYGCIDAGMTGNPSILLSKSVLDLFTAMVFGCSLGAVTSVIAIPQFLIFTCLFLAAKLIYPLTTPAMINDFKACGGFLLLATGLRMTGIKAFPIADMIPAMILVMPLSGLWSAYVVPLL